MLQIPPSQVTRNDTSEIGNIYRSFCEMSFGGEAHITNMNNYWMQAGISTFFGRYLVGELIAPDRMILEAEMGRADLELELLDFKEGS